MVNSKNRRNKRTNKKKRIKGNKKCRMKGGSINDPYQLRKMIDDIRNPPVLSTENKSRDGVDDNVYDNVDDNGYYLAMGATGLISFFLGGGSVYAGMVLL